MENKKFIWTHLGTSAEVSLFEPQYSDIQPNNPVREIHVMLHVTPRGDLFPAQAVRLQQSLKLLLQESDLQGASPVYQRFFLSDAANQAALLSAMEVTKGNSIATSYIQQPPLDGSRIALWIYLQQGTNLSQQEGFTVSEHNGYRHLFQWGLTQTEGNSFDQTRALLEDYEAALGKQQMTIEANTVRTWFMVRDVDSQYAGLVKARRENFEEQGLRRDTHYIASTGIGGTPADPRAIIQLDTYALAGFDPQQLHYLYAKSHLNPTYEYGVTFERGTAVEYGDRAQIFISGTASIDHRGEVLHVGDILRQTERMWENVEALLSEGNATFDDVAQMIVYLRDTADYEIVSKLFDERFPKIPKVITWAPVCRPAWLIEMECIALPHRNNTTYRNF